MNTEPNISRPSENFSCEVEAFLTALDTTPPNSLTACAGWTAHEVVAHLVAAGVEVALNLEAYGDGRAVPTTRSFDEREAPYRDMADASLRDELPRSIVRMGAALDAVLLAEPDAVVPWTGRQMVVKTFITHLRSELALHRWDLVGDDATGDALLANPLLTDHAVSVLGRPLLVRGSGSTMAQFMTAIGAPDTRDVVVVVDLEGPRLVYSDGPSDPSVIGDPAARLLLLWGRQCGDPRRLRSLHGTTDLGQLKSVLAGY